ncbi:TPA: hypothetical protein DDW35_00820 [Candidatus Sumerlaeota bacterium]|nr:hypothetical protein [Candidatus Sumerlaeota bacterium]
MKTSMFPVAFLSFLFALLAPIASLYALTPVAEGDAAPKVQVEKPAVAQESMPHPGRLTAETAPLPPAVIPKGISTKPVALPLDPEAENYGHAAITGPTLKGLSGEQVRAIWVQADGPELKTADNRVALVKRLKTLNVTDVFLEVRLQGMAYYKSEVSPRPVGWMEPTCDPLGDILKMLKSEDAKSTATIRVHAVFDTLRLFKGDGAFEPPEGHLMQSHPEWVMQNRLGKNRDSQGWIWLDPGVPGVSQQLEAAVRELVSAYPLDGIHFASLYYPGNGLEWGYNAQALADFQGGQESQKKPAENEGDEKPAKKNLAELMASAPAPSAQDWVRWRANKITALLETLSAAARQERPGIIVSASVLASGDCPSADAKAQPDYVRGMQWWPSWCTQNLVDWVVLKNAMTQESDQARFIKWMDFADSRKGKVKSIVMVAGAVNEDKAVVGLMLMAVARECDGILLNSYQHTSRDESKANSVLEYIGKTIYSPQYVILPYMTRKIMASLPEKSTSFPEMDLSNLPTFNAAATPTPKVVAAKTPEPPSTQETAGLALLGKKKKAADDAAAVASAAKKKKESVFEVRRGSDLPEIPNIATTLKYFTVEMTTGRKFIAARIADNDNFSVFQIKGQDVQFAVPKKQIKKSTPYQGE